MSLQRFLGKNMSLQLAEALLPSILYRLQHSRMTLQKIFESSSWKYTMICSAYLGLSLSLEGVGAVLGLEEQKLKEGKNQIKYFCSPCQSTKANDSRTRNLTGHNPEKWGK